MAHADAPRRRLWSEASSSPSAGRTTIGWVGMLLRLTSMTMAGESRMGEARRRGTAQERQAQAWDMAKQQLIAKFGDADARNQGYLRTALQAFLGRMTPEDWNARREAILQSLRGRPSGSELATAASIRVQADEIAWYLFLCQQALEDPVCTDISQSQRALPFFAGLGARWQHAQRVQGLGRKLDELLTDYRQEPDGLLFEILVALAYAAEGWEVTLLPEGAQKTPDMHIVREGREFFVECKRMARKTQYAETERNEFLQRWDRAKSILLANRQWVWFKGDFHVEASTLEPGFLADVFRGALPLSPAGSGKLIHQSDQATIHARLIDHAAVREHMRGNWVKAHSPTLIRLLGADWAPDNAATTILHMVKTAQVAWCDVPVLGSYVDEIGFACGFTRSFDAEDSIDKKARDVTKLLSEAVKQVPADRPSIIHIAAETMEGAVIERRRTEKVMQRVPGFTTGKPVAAVRFHRLQGHQRTDLLYELDETVDNFQLDHIDLTGMPATVVAPPDTALRKGSHWNLYS